MKFSKEFKIGLFVVVVLAVSFALINFLRGKDLFNREMTLVSHYEDVGGLLPSAPVYIKGYKAGTVTAVEYDPEAALFEVSCSVLRKFRVPEDSRMTLYSVDIMGGKGIRIDLGTSEIEADDKGVLEPNVEADLMSSLASGLGPLLTKATSALDSIGIAAGKLNSLLAEIPSGQVQSIVAHLDRTAASAEKVLTSVSGKSEELEEFIGNLRNVSSALVSVSQKADTTVTNLNNLTSSLSESDIEGLVSSLRSLLDKVQDPDGSLGKFISDDGVYDSVDSILSDVDSLINRISTNPKKYLKISIF